MDSTQAKALIKSLQGQSLDGWLINGDYGYGKSAVVVPAKRDGINAAVKVFHPELVERFGRQVQLARIQREVSLIGHHHPNLVQILGGGECVHSGHLYVAMEQVPHKNLLQCLQQLPQDSIRLLIGQLASATRFLEDLGLVHRDIKPENIAITPDFSKAILLDLGVLKPVGFSTLTDVDARPFIGTLRYSSPEFLRRKEKPTLEGGRAITFYQLGAVLHDMLMKRPLFSHHVEPYSEVVEAVLNERPEIHAEDTRSVALANRCLVKNPETRLQLVTWADFDMSAPAELANLAAIQHRLEARQKYFRSEAKPSEIPATETSRAQKQLLEDSANSLATRVATQLNASSLFPLRRIISEKDLKSRTFAITVQFEKDEAFGLMHKLIVRIAVKLIDENAGNPMFEAESCSALFDTDTQPLLQTNSTFFKGEISALLDSSLLEQQFAMAMEGAYIEQDKGLPQYLNTPKIIGEEKQ